MKPLGILRGLLMPLKTRMEPYKTLKHSSGLYKPSQICRGLREALTDYHGPKHVLIHRGLIRPFTRCRGLHPLQPLSTTSPCPTMISQLYPGVCVCFCVSYEPLGLFNGLTRTLRVFKSLTQPIRIVRVPSEAPSKTL